MVPGLVTTEIETGRDGDELGFQHVLTESVGIAAEGADIGIQIESALRLHRYHEAQLAQRRQQEVTTPGELGATRLEDFQRRRLETRQRRMLGHARGTDVEVLRQLLQLRHRGRRGDEPASRQPVMPKYLEKLLSTKAWSSTSRTLGASMP